MEKSVQNHSLPCCPAEFPWSLFPENLRSRARGVKLSMTGWVLEIKGETEEGGALQRPTRGVFCLRSFSLLLAVAVVWHAIYLCALPSVPRLHYGCVLPPFWYQLFTEGKALEQLFGCVNSGPPSTTALRYAEQYVPISQGLSTLLLTALQSGMHLWNSPKQTLCTSYSTGWFFWWCGHILSL